MTTLEEAWAWYQATAHSLWRVERIGRKYWTAPELEQLLGNDNHFRDLTGAVVEGESKNGREPLDDLAVVVLFSVFESRVRDYLIARLEPEVAKLTEPILKAAAEDAVRGVEEGSFYRRVLDPLKQQQAVNANLVTEVDQVRDYRNWVAHGRRGNPTNAVDPKTAYERLSRFLTVLIPDPRKGSV
jgi:hypothetical protein